MIATIESAVAELKQQLLQLPIGDLAVSDYTKSYFRDYIKKLDFTLKASGKLLEVAASNSGKPINETVIVDNGAGIGILTILAKKTGFKSVVYHDIFEPASKDAQVLAKACGVQFDEVIVGDTDVLIKQLNQKGHIPDVIISRNVIEHIYSVDEHLRQFSAIKNPELLLAFSTTANVANPLVSAYTRRIHKAIEYKGIKGKWDKERDAKKAFLDVRKEIIRKHFPEASVELINELASRTRGLIERDIIQVISNYKENNRLPAFPKDRSNTCDPYTGNWAENLLSIEDYRRSFERSGFSFSVENGFYNTQYKQSWLNGITKVMNILISMFPHTISLSPFIILIGKKK
jgi:2-polyprenyl-3-methyl-5-hydroxy-6-metoxy-1,4-benzoquinol methylase